MGRGEAGYEPVSSDNWAKLCNLNNTLSFAFNSKKSFSRFNKRRKKILGYSKKTWGGIHKMFYELLKKIIQLNGPLHSSD